MIITRSGTSFLDIKKTSTTKEFPDRFTDYVRSFGEVYFWEKGNFHVITKAEHARDILTSEAYSADRGSFFISRMPNLDLSLIHDFFGVVKKMMVMSDDEDHVKRRKLAAEGFDDHVMERYKSKVQETIISLVSELKGLRQVEFVEMVARKLPSIVLADLFSIPHSDRENFFRWSNTMTGFFGGASQYRNEDGVEVNHAAKSLREYFVGLVQERRVRPGDDYVSILVRSQESFKLSDDELLSQLIMMLVAGQVTTTDQINNIIYQLAQRKDVQETLRASPHLVPNALEEFKRLDPAVTFIFRVARASTKVGEQEIRPGDVMFISTHAINRDLPSEARPHELDIFRKGFHFAYGYGPHYCLGAKLGRMEMQLLFEALLKELPLFQLDEKRNSIRDHYSLSFSGFKSLHLEFLA